jgi:hypothetical protein
MMKIKNITTTSQIKRIYNLCLIYIIGTETRHFSYHECSAYFTLYYIYLDVNALDNNLKEIVHHILFEK